MKSKEEIVAVGTAAGFLKIIDVKKSRIIQKISIGDSQIFDCDWGDYGIVTV